MHLGWDGDEGKGGVANALLLSGGVDSTALAAWRTPDLALFIDYGQRPARGELAAARAVTKALNLTLHVVRVQSDGLGSGLLAGSSPIPEAPSPEWWPFRNQLLATVGAAWGIDKGVRTIAFGSVVSDAARHVDGSAVFYRELDRLISMQEGGIRIVVPSIEMTTAKLIGVSRVTDEVLAWTHSCHVASLACGVCPGCMKRRVVLMELGRLM